MTVWGPKFKLGSLQTIVWLATDVTWQTITPMFTWTLVMSVPNRVPLMVKVVFGKINDVGDMAVIVGVRVELNVKLQFALQTADTPFTLVWIGYVPDWSCCVANVILL